MPQSRKRQKQEENSIKYIITKLLTGSILGTVSFFVLLGLTALIILKKPIDSKLFPIISLFIAALTAFLSGFVSVRPIRKNGILMGIASGLPLCITVAVATLFESKGNIGVMLAVTIAVIVICAAVGGVFAVNKKKRTQ